MLLLAPASVALAGPTVGEVLAVCARAQAQGNAGVDAAACDWYAMPCDCKAARRGQTRWCVPVDETAERTLERVVAALGRLPDRSAPAEPAVAAILARLYPCAD
jgi:hypothetical protein